MTKTAESTSQRLVSAVRKIAQESVLKDGLLGPAAAKSGIGKTRGAAYYNANGDIETGNKVPDEAATSSADSGGAGDSSGGSSTKQNSYAPIADADAAQVGDTFDQFEGFDCTTGDKIQLDLTPLPGAEYMPPDGWFDADTPPVDPGYQAGYYWAGYGDSYVYIRASTPVEAWNLFVPVRESFVGLQITEVIGIEETIPGARYKYTYIMSNDELYTEHINRYQCGSVSDDYCVVVPLLSSWPSDNTTSLILQNGALQAHSMDPDAAEIYKTNPPSEIEMCDGQGSRYSITALEGGGAMVTKLDGNGDPIADGRSLIIDSGGVVTKRVQNTWRDGYL